MVLQPGNPGACAIPPAGADFKVCIDGDMLCLPIKSEPGACPPAAGTVSRAAVGEGDHTHGPPVAAVVVPVAVVAAAALAAVGFVWHRRRRIGGEVQPAHGKPVYRVSLALP